MVCVPPPEPRRGSPCRDVPRPTRVLTRPRTPPSVPSCFGCFGLCPLNYDDAPLPLPCASVPFFRFLFWNLRYYLFCFCWHVWWRGEAKSSVQCSKCTLYGSLRAPSSRTESNVQKMANLWIRPNEKLPKMRLKSSGERLWKRRIHNYFIAIGKGTMGLTAIFVCATQLAHKKVWPMVCPLMAWGLHFLFMFFNWR